jgi:hypothetical protein
MTATSTAIFDYKDDTYKELVYHTYTINESWKNKIKIFGQPEKYGYDDETYLIDVYNGIYSPNKCELNVDVLHDTDVKLFKRDDSSMVEINKEFVNLQLQKLKVYYSKLYNHINGKTSEDSVDATAYTNYINQNIANFAILKYLYNSEIKNKYMCFGTAGNFAQIIPNYIIKDIIEKGEQYEIFMFETCDDDSAVAVADDTDADDDSYVPSSFKCAPVKKIYNYIKEKLGDVNSIQNIKIYHIYNQIEILSFWYILQSIYKVGTQIILCDTISSGHEVKKEVDKYNNLLRIINNETTENNFTTNFLELKKIISYVCTGQKIIFYSNTREKFVGHHTNEMFLLDILSFDIIKNNNIEERFNIKEGTTSHYESKYLKYKNKYLKLKSTLTK